MPLLLFFFNQIFQFFLIIYIRQFSRPSLQSSHIQLLYSPAGHCPAAPSMLQKQNNRGASKFKIAFFCSLFHLAGILFQVCDLSNHHGTYFHHHYGAKLLCTDQSIFSCILTVNRKRIISCRINSMIDPGQRNIF